MDLAGELQQVVDLFTGVDGIETCSLDLSAIVPPGVLVQLVDIGELTLAHRQLSLQLILVVGDSDGGPGAAAQLGTLLAAVETIATADGPILARSVLLPSSPSPLPGLVFPLNWKAAR